MTAYAQTLEATRSPQALDAAWQNGARLIAALREEKYSEMADALGELQAQRLGDLQAQAEPPPITEPEEEVDEPEGPEVVDPEEDEPEPAVGYNVDVPWPDGMPANQWHMAARSKLLTMVGAHRPPEDYVRLRATNAPSRPADRGAPELGQSVRSCHRARGWCAMKTMTVPMPAGATSRRRAMLGTGAKNQLAAANRQRVRQPATAVLRQRCWAMCRVASWRSPGHWMGLDHGHL